MLITLIRHAKTEPGSFGRDDFDRKLLEKGHLDSHKIAIWCKANLPPANIWLVSPARRTSETASIVASHWHTPAQIHQPNELYAASSTRILTMLEETSASYLQTAEVHLLLIGHNPGVSDAATELGGGTVTQHLPTGALAHFQIAPDITYGLQNAQTERLHLITPAGLPTPN